MRALYPLTITLLILACGIDQAASRDTDPAVEVVSASDVEWTPLNPLRGDKGPKAATLWGNRSGTGPTGFLVEFVDGFSSPPHIHNVTYRGVVIDGLVHNDDPNAAELWMPEGSFWTQPAGEVHITSAKGSDNIAYIEIDKAPYLVLPPKEAFDEGERPVNIHASNLVWVEPPGAPGTHGGAKVSYLWGDPQDSQPSGTLVRLPAGYRGDLRGLGTRLRAVVIRGEVDHRLPGLSDVQTLEPGSYFSSKDDTVHQIACKGSDACTLYMRTRGTFGFGPAQTDK